MSEAPTISLHCAQPLLKTQLAIVLESQGQFLAQLGAVALVIDVPTPSGLLMLEHLSGQRAVFVTDNPCPEYWLDVLATGVEGFLFRCVAIDDLFLAVSAVANGQRLIKHPKTVDALSAHERRILRCIAEGLTSEEIGARFGLKTKVVRNYVSMILSSVRLAHPELRVTARPHLVQYYFGLWDLLRRDTESPRDVTNIT